MGPTMQRARHPSLDLDADAPASESATSISSEGAGRIWRRGTTRVCAPPCARNPKTPTWPAIPKIPTWTGILKEFRRNDGRASALTSLISAVVIFNGQTFRDGADFKRPISDGQLLNYEDTLLYVGGLEGYDGTLPYGWIGSDLLIETSFS